MNNYIDITLLQNFSLYCLTSIYLMDVKLLTGNNMIYAFIMRGEN